MGKTQSKLEPASESSLKSPQTTAQTAAPVPTAFPRVDMDFLIQPPDEASIKRPWMQLSNLIDSHVQAFYNGSNELGYRRESIREDLREFDMVQDARDIDELTELLHSTRHRKLGLRICIARAVLSSIDFRGHPRATSLDHEVVALMRRFDQLNPNPSPEEEAALSQWRIITASFLAPGSKDLREGRLPCEGLLVDFLSVFRQGSDSRGGEDKDWRGSIRTIVLQGVDVGEKLFCHPSTWSFAWQATPIITKPLTINGTDVNSYFPHESTNPSPVIVFPALIETAIQTGSDARPEPNIVQAADTGCGLVFFRGEIMPASVLLPMDGTAFRASPGLPVYLEVEQGPAVITHRTESGSSRSKKKESSRRHHSSETYVILSNRLPKPLRRSSTMEGPQPPGRSGTSRSLEAESDSRSSGRRRIGRHTA
ncbi:hypothetical protein QBC44DRAFT_320727 [Cladorrhinum sp. PSN332]|nr:hypothetical protein QBC44DRAFT_320727 [Cladorrhinum sp. PSN332]